LGLGTVNFHQQAAVVVAQFGTVVNQVKRGHDGE
jgi:hypothetical protein